MSANRAPTLPAIFLRFFRFGLLAWGGPIAQIAMIKRELVEEERWLEPARFNRLLAVYQVLPGPEAHELCVHIGMMKRGRLGGLLAGLGFMLPGLVLILALAWLYVQLSFDHPFVRAAFLGIQAGVVALIARALHRIADHALGRPLLWAVALIGASATALGVPFWIVLPACGPAYAAAASRRYGLVATIAFLAVGLAFLADTALPTGTGQHDGLVPHGSVAPLPLFLAGLKAGLLTFGGAYTAIPFVRGDAVGRGWVNDAQFLDALAIGGVIPAPLVIFATFVGYLAGGLAGALAITAGIFLPAFAFAMLFYDRLERVVDDERLHRLLEGVAAALVGLVAVTAVQLAASVARSIPSVALGAALFTAALALLYLWRSRLAVPVVVLGTGLAGIALFA